MTAAGGAARSNDTGGIKRKSLEYIRLTVPGQRLIPEIQPAMPKSMSRGWHHRQITELLMPAMYKPEYKKNPDQYVHIYLI